jgi:hypothetical protein
MIREPFGAADGFLRRTYMELMEIKKVIFASLVHPGIVPHVGSLLAKATVSLSEEAKPAKLRKPIPHE